MLYQAIITRTSRDTGRLANEECQSFSGMVAGTAWQACHRSEGKQPHSSQEMIAAAVKPSHGSRTGPQTA